MKTMTMLAACVLGIFLVSANAKEASGNQKHCGDIEELKAGHMLADGTVAGEKKALAYFAKNQPRLHKKLLAMDKEQMRSEFAEHFVWFQRDLPCRTGQKLNSTIEMLEKLNVAGSAPGHDGVAACSERELAPGTTIEDGSIAGEAEALAYFKDREPELYSRLSSLSQKEMRDEYGEYFAPFQRVGACRQRQKADAIKELKTMLDI